MGHIGSFIRQDRVDTYVRLKTKTIKLQNFYISDRRLDIPISILN